MSYDTAASQTTGQININDEKVQWVHGESYINTIGGVVGLFSHLSVGDYVKKINDSNDKYLRVEKFCINRRCRIYCPKAFKGYQGNGQ